MTVPPRQTAMDAFDYPLPDDRIAQHPVEPRDAARLLVDEGDDRPPSHRFVRDLPSLLQPGDLVVVNDTKVIPARLHLRRPSGGAVEVLLLEQLRHDPTTWEALVRPSRKVPHGEELVSVHGDDLRVVMGERVGDEGIRLVRVVAGDVMSALDVHGETPLPPYIHEPVADPARYNTVYANRPGSVAAPTAGLHLTPSVIDALGAAGVGFARVELVVGLGTFRPITVDDPADHVMHRERVVVRPEVLERCRAVRSAGGRVVAIGTTSVRALESAAAGVTGGHTDLFIRRGYEWQLVDVLLTNFHLPRTSLLVMIDAFVGPRWRRLYDAALADPGYRFLSFGDAMLLTRQR
jgi:S-adenosylmethionine:tRNA ribosyltransferase-isomerase